MRRTNVGCRLAHRLRHWLKIEPTIFHRLVFVLLVLSQGIGRMSSGHTELLAVRDAGPVFSYKLRYIVGFGLVEMAISTNPKPTIYRNLYENTDPVLSTGVYIVNMIDDSY